MNKLIFLLVLIAFALPVHAEQCLTSVSATTSADTVTTGTDFTISVTPTSTSQGSDCTVSTLSLSGTPSSYTISDPPASQNNQYSGVSAGTTKTFTVSIGSAGTYELTPTGTTGDGSVSGTAIIVEAVDPSTLTVSSSPSTAQVDTNENFTMDVTLSGSTSDVSTSYTLSVPAGLERDSGTSDRVTNTITVLTDGSYSLSWVILQDECYTGEKNVTLTIGDNSQAVVIGVDGNTTCDSGNDDEDNDTSSGGGGGGSSSTTTTAGSDATLRLLYLKSGSNITLSAGISTSTTNLREIEVQATNTIVNAYLDIDTSDSRPATARSSPGTGTIYTYITISRTNITDNDVGSVDIEFEVPKSWLSDNNIDKNTVALYRYTSSSDSWAELPTELSTEESTLIVYRATSPGLSIFAIGGESTTGEPSGTPEVLEAGIATTNATGNATNETQTGEGEPFQFPDFEINFFLLAGVVLIAVGGIALFLRARYSVAQKRATRFMPKQPKKQVPKNFRPKKKRNLKFWKR